MYISKCNTLKITCITATVLLSICGASPLIAAPLSLDQVPLFTKNSAKANLILSIDDSGSMDSEVLFPTNDGALWWQTAKNSFVESGAAVFNTSGSANNSWKKYTYLFPNGTGSGKRIYSDSTHNHYAIPPLPQYAFTRSNEYNKMYYDPNVTYRPWVNHGSDTYSNISESSAPSDPSTGSSTKNLITENKTENSNQVFKVYSEMVLPIGTEYYDGSWKTVSGTALKVTSESNWGFKYYPATYFVPANEKAHFTVGPPTGGTKFCSSPSAADYLTFEANPGTLTDVDALGVVDALGPDGRCLLEVKIESSINTYSHNGERTDCASSSVCTYAEEIQNFANWYSYYRKRHLAIRAGMGNAFDGITALRSGIFTINSRTDVTMRDLSNGTDHTAFYDQLYAIDGNSGGTPNRKALGHAGEQFKRTGSGAPIIEQCQKNFTLFFTDGFSTTDTPSISGWDDDNNEGAPYADSYDKTLADIAMHYYKTNLRPDLTSGDVPVNNGCNVASPDPILDCNANLHMNTYTVGLGAKGTIFGVSHNVSADAYTTPPVWPNVNSARDKTQVDDLYHAAVNGRGEMYNADSADDLQTKLQSALVSIQAQLGSSSAVTFNTATLEANSSVYLALFNSANWSGDLRSYTLDPYGNISLTESWSAAKELDNGTPTYDTRVIITRGTSSGIPFRWNNLTTAQQNDLESLAAASGQEVLNYIRGQRTNESAGKLRIRDSAMGDIINGSPVFVGSPALQWPSNAPFPTSSGETYSDFIASNQSSPRDKIVYVGSNDGMLHGFNAKTGEEVIGYIPSMLFSTNSSEGLHYLADPLYQHRYYVDLTSTVSDVYIDSTNDNINDTAWTTVLLGGLRGGGKGIFLLNITDPTYFTESPANAAKLALWEFSHTEMGYTYSKPTIAMMENGRWAAIFGNGYNNTGTGEASLFIVFLDGGIDGTWTDGSSGTDQDYIILTTKTGSTTTPNGLATPRVIDLDGNGAADRAYAGDLQGNMWAFDLSNTNVNPSWDIAYKSGSTPKPLFIAKDDSNNIQPITSRPTVRSHPTKADSNNNSPNLLIMFGTGKFLEATDLTSTDEQAFYGIWDHGDNSLERGDLVEQTIGTVTADPSDPLSEVYRTVTDNNVNYSNKDGWFIELPASGERQVVDPVLRGSLVFFNTWIPSSDACSAGGYGYLMSVEIENGGTPNSPVFDTNGDGIVDDADKVSGTNPAGQGFNNGLPASSRFLGNKEYIPGTDGNEIMTRDVQDLEGLQTGRLSWQELAPK